ncbi:RipA family octameric membrane protein [Desulfovibrio sp. Fe33]|uniref:RipA family octameric membrane protein n=1 Tax=Desulfovibrio sp. Fe33 TaxID=3020842 RepID=UPI003FA46CF0
MPPRTYAEIMFEEGTTTGQGLTLEGKNRAKEAYQKAHDVRKFEIDLYWKRALYFWAFEGAFLTAYGIILAKGTDVDGQFYYLAVLSLFALCFTYLWSLALKGSKQWQENWELHIDFLEECFSGNLYKTVLYRKEKKGNFYSVSRINERITYLFMLIWSTTFVGSLLKELVPHEEWVWGMVLLLAPVYLVATLLWIWDPYSLRTNLTGWIQPLSDDIECIYREANANTVIAPVETSSE